jgi:hypothetical protein
MEITAVDPTINSDKEKIGLLSKSTPSLRSSTAAKPSAMIIIAVNSEYFVLHELYR